MSTRRSGQIRKRGGRIWLFTVAVVFLIVPSVASAEEWVSVRVDLLSNAVQRSWLVCMGRWEKAGFDRANEVPPDAFSACMGAEIQAGLELAHEIRERFPDYPDPAALEVCTLEARNAVPMLKSEQGDPYPSYQSLNSCLYTFSSSDSAERLKAARVKERERSNALMREMGSDWLVDERPVE